VPNLLLVLMRWIACCFVLANASLVGCAPLGSVTEKVAIGFSMLRSPITLRTPEVDVLYFPVNLTQLSEFDRFAIEDGEEMFNKVSRISTDYVIRVDHDKLLARAVEQILDADQSGEGRHPLTGWPVGPHGSEIHQLGDAFVRAIAFAEAGH